MKSYLERLLGTVSLWVCRFLFLPCRPCIPSHSLQAGSFPSANYHSKASKFPSMRAPSWQLVTTAVHKGGLNSLWRVSLEFTTSTPTPKSEFQTKLREETLYFNSFFNDFFSLESEAHLEITDPGKYREKKQNKALRPMCLCIPETSTDGNCTEEGCCQSWGETDCKRHWGLEGWKWQGKYPELGPTWLLKRTPPLINQP